MANNNNVTNINLGGLLNLNKFKSEIRQFDGFNEKNSPIYGGILSPFYSSEKEESSLNEVFLNNKVYRMIDGDNNDCYFQVKDVTTDNRFRTIKALPKKKLKKTNISVPYKILAFDLHPTDENKILMFVEGTDSYMMYEYNITTNTYRGLNSHPLHKISKPTIRYGMCFFVDDETKEIIGMNGDYLTNNPLDSDADGNYEIDNMILTLNKLDSTFDYNGNPRYLLSICGNSGRGLNSSIYTENRIVTYETEYSSWFLTDKLTIAEISPSTGRIENELPSYAIETTDNEVKLYYVNVDYLDTHRAVNTYYLSGVVKSYDSSINTLYVSVKASIIMNDTSSNYDPNEGNVTVNVKPFMDINPYFYSICITANNTTSGNVSCVKHNVYFDSSRDYAIGNNGYIKTSNTDAYFPYGSKVSLNTSNDYFFSFLINNSYISNISVEDNSNVSVGTIVADWNIIDNEVTPKIKENMVLYKTSTSNSINIIKLEYGSPKMNIIFDRYIVIDTPFKTNTYDTTYYTFYHGFIDYNNRVVPCEKTKDHTIGLFPYANGVSLNLKEKVKNYIYASAVNPMIEISKIPFSSIQYNPLLINYGRYDTFATKGLNDVSYVGTEYYNEAVDVYVSDKATDTTPIYYRTFTDTVSYVKQSLYELPYPITTSGNILYSSNIFSEIINSFSNKDMIVNDNVAYPILYINNQPTFSFYFLSGIEFTNSSFVIQGMSYVNTDDYIFSVSYSNGIISSSEPLVNIKGFRFLGNTTKLAFYFCEVKKSIYAFYGDRTLEKLYDCNGIGNINNVFFNPNNYNIYIVTDDKAYVIDDESVFTIDIPNITKMFFSKDFIFIDSDSYYYLLSYEYVEGVSKNKIHVKVVTQYYGLGNNIKSIIDCIYLRLFNDDSFQNGRVKLNVSTVTECGIKSEEKTFNISASDWDKETNTIYLRYQPKYQECVGMSVAIESDFAIATLDMSSSSQGVVQISKYNA